MKRRDALRWMAIGAGAGASTRLPWIGDAAFASFLPTTARAAFVPDVELALRAGPGEARILTGGATRVWKFTGQVIKGPSETLQVIPNSFLGPVIRLRKGQKVRIRFSHTLPEPTIVHWHGLDVPSAMDGHPHLLVDQGREYVYEFDATNRAGTYWYHPHPHMRTGSQVYHGLAGLLLISDDEEAALNLPSGTEEILCVLQDRTFDTANQLTYIAGGMMSQMHGFLGDRILVNGQEHPSLTLATRAYRLRVLNGSNARIYKLMWSDGTPMTIIGTDGGLLERPRDQTYVTLAPAQRADLIVDLSRHPVGARLELQSARFPATDVDAGGMGMGMAMGGGSPQNTVPNGAPLSLLGIEIVRHETSSFRLPSVLSTFGATWQGHASQPPRRIVLSFRAGQWTMGGRTFEMTEAAPDEIVQHGSTQIWELVNSPGMMGMQMAHPIHLHGPQFRVLSRSGSAKDRPSVREGLTDEGWKDTILVMPDETVRILVNFTQHPGLYLYHCHILEHEDMGMMRNFRVT